MALSLLSLSKYTLDKCSYFQLLITLIFHETRGKKEPELSRFLVKFLGNNILSRVNGCKNILRNPRPQCPGSGGGCLPWLVKCLQIENSAQRLVLSPEWRVAGDQRGRCQQSGAALHSTEHYRPCTARQSPSPISVSRHSLTSSTSDISIITFRPITSCHY